MRNKIKSKSLDPPEKFICPVCGNKFDPNDDTKYIISGGYTCNWKCFLNEAKRRDAEKKEKGKDKK